MEVAPEHQFNKLHDDIEIERATPPSRALPGEAPPSGHPAIVKRPPNRLVDLSKPIKTSERAKNAFRQTVFDDLQPQRPEINGTLLNFKF